MTREQIHARRVARTIAGESTLAFGYRKLYVPFHPSSAKGYVFEHRLVAERAAGRFLRREEIVHHLNEDRLDNRPENLAVVSKAWHQRHHMTKCPLTDAEVRELILLGRTTRFLARFSVNTHRMVRIRRDVGIPERASIAVWWRRACPAHRDLIQIEMQATR